MKCQGTFKTVQARWKPSCRTRCSGSPPRRQEYSRYIDYVIANPHSAPYYKAIFAAIYTLTPRMLSRFDLITLFHLGEFFRKTQANYAPLDDAGLLELFMTKLKRGGKILFYRDSGYGGSRRTRAILQRFTEEGKLMPAGEYKSLMIYQPVPLRSK